MTGVVQAIDKFGYRRFFDWCYAGYAYVQRLDQNYSDWLRVSKSIKTTSVEQRPARTRRAQSKTRYRTGWLVACNGAMHGPSTAEKSPRSRDRIRADRATISSHTRRAPARRSRRELPAATRDRTRPLGRTLRVVVEAIGDGPRFVRPVAKASPRQPLITSNCAQSGSAGRQVGIARGPLQNRSV